MRANIGLLFTLLFVSLVSGQTAWGFAQAGRLFFTRSARWRVKAYGSKSEGDSDPC